MPKEHLPPSKIALYQRNLNFLMTQKSYKFHSLNALEQAARIYAKHLTKPVRYSAFDCYSGLTDEIHNIPGLSVTYLAQICLDSSPTKSDPNAFFELLTIDKRMNYLPDSLLLLALARLKEFEIILSLKVYIPTIRIVHISITGGLIVIFH